MTEYLDLADYLLIAEAVLGVAAEEIARWPGIGLAESALHAPAAGFAGVELYPEVIDKAAVLCVRLARNHALPDGNKRVAYLGLLEFLARNGIEWGAAFRGRDSCNDRASGCRRGLRARVGGLASVVTWRLRRTSGCARTCRD